METTTSQTTQTTELVFRRLNEPLKLFGQELDPLWWVALLVVLLLAAFFYVGWMYLKDSRTIGPAWAVPLGLLRGCVYLMLAGIFLLPAIQHWEENRDQSRVIVIPDTSLSMGTIDDLPEEGKKFTDLPTRQDKVLSLLQHRELAFLKELMERNPVTIHRFGTRVDENFFVYADGQVLSRDDLESRQKEADPTKKAVKVGMTRGLLSAWLKPESKDQQLLPGNKQQQLLQQIDQLAASLDQNEGDLHLTEPQLALLKEYGSWEKDTNLAKEPNAEKKPEVKEETSLLWKLGQGGLVLVIFVLALVLALKVGRSFGPWWTAGIGVAGCTVCVLLALWFFLPSGSADNKPTTTQEPLEQPRTAAREIKNGMLLTGEEKQAIKERLAADKERIKKLLAYNAKQVEAGIFNGTNVTDSVLAVVNKEINKMVQGIIVVTDGRNSTSGSSLTLLTLEQRAKAANIPIFVVGVGTQRPHVKIEFVDIRVPQMIRPEDSFRGVIEVTGEGLPEQPADVRLEVTRSRKTRDDKEELLDLVLVESDPKGPKDQKKQEIILGKRVELLPTEPVKFDRGSPPRAEVEFQIDAAALARAAGVDLTTEMYRGKKWEIAETQADSKGGDEIRFQAFLPKHKAEIFAEEKHISEKVGMRVLRKPLEILLFASGPMRDYQFLRTLLVREMEKDRVKLCLYIQPQPGSTEKRTGVVQDVPAKRLLEAFPDKFDQPTEDEEEKFKDLSTYDVIVAFDPDWNQLSDKQLENVRKWVDRGGGLIVVGGPLHTLQLARPGANKDKLKPILELYPVVLKDIRIEEIDRKPDRPWPLSFEGASPEMEFLKLSDDVERGLKPFLSDWQEFFGRNLDNPDKTAVIRGFYNYYPVEYAKTGAIVVARFTDPQSKLKDGTQQPFLVINPDGANRRVVWVGSGEMWRLRQYKEAFHERFWTKLARFAGSANQGKSNKRITATLGPRHITNRSIEFVAKIDGKGGQPLSPNAKPPEVTLKPPAGVPLTEMPKDLVMKPKPHSDGRFTVKFQIRSPGEYGLELRVPETKDSWNGKFKVEQSNPELDNTRPDFDLMYRMASEADLVLARMGPAEKQELRKRLAKPLLTESKDVGRPDAKEAPREAKDTSEEKLRLYFDLKNADLIPSCMKTDEKVLRSYGPYRDLWDDSFTFSLFEKEIKLPYYLLLAVFLLSLEWLVRKLLRLA